MEKYWSRKGVMFFEKFLKNSIPDIYELLKKENEFLKKKINKNSIILDVGCGFGRHIELLASSSKKVIGIDNNKIMIEKARKLLENFSNVELFVERAEKLHFGSNTFDYVICMTNTLGNFGDTKLNALKEMKRVCDKGGKIITGVYSERALEARFKNYQKLLKDVGLSIIKVEDGKIFAEGNLVSEQFSKSQLTVLFAKAGLDVKIHNLTPIYYICESTK